MGAKWVVRTHNGSVATTQNEFQFVTNGLGAVGKFVLPNPTSAVQKIFVQTDPLAIKCGTCMSKPGLAGEGVV